MSIGLTPNSDILFFRNKTVINVVGEKPFPCEICGKEFARKAALRIHKISVHTNLKSYLCADCGAAFKANSALIDHKKRVHLQIKPHRCEYCGKEFFSKKDYGEHTRTHTGEKPFQCQLCGKCFGRGYHLKRHTDGVHRHPGLLGPDGTPLAGVQLPEAATITVTPQSPGPGGGGLTIDSFPQFNKKPKKSKPQAPKVPLRQTLVTTPNISFSESQPVPTFALSLPAATEDTKQLLQNQVDIKPILSMEEKPYSDLKVYDHHDRHDHHEHHDRQDHHDHHDHHDRHDRAPLDLAQRTSQQMDIEAGATDTADRSAPFTRADDSPLRNNLEIHETREAGRSPPTAAYTGAQPTYIVSNFYRAEHQTQGEYVEAIVEQAEADKIYKI